MGHAMPFFDTFAAADAPTQSGWWVMRRLNNYHLDRLAELGAKGRYLEIGPGVGPFARLCAERNIPYVAIEPNEKLGAMIRAMGHDVIPAMIPPIPLPEGSIAVLHASHVIEHCATYREALAFIAEAARVVEPGGLVSIAAPDFDHLGNEFYRTHYSHALPINVRRLSQLMEDNGLVVERADLLSGPFHGPLRWVTQSLARLAPVWLLRALSLGRLSAAQCYSAKMTFMRAVWLVGRRPDQMGG
jgi:SAM-dependent methyltransferase